MTFATRIGIRCFMRISFLTMQFDCGLADYVCLVFKCKQNLSIIPLVEINLSHWGSGVVLLLNLYLTKRRNTMNKVILRGYIGGEPFISMSEGKPFAAISFATNKHWKQSGEKKTKVRWHKLLFFGKQVDVVCYLKKGTHLLIEGELDYRKSTDRSGVEHTDTSIIVEHLEFLDSKNPSEENQTLADKHLAESLSLLD